MLGVRVKLKDAEKVKKFIVENNHIDKDYNYNKDKTYIYFPVKAKFSGLMVQTKFLEMDFDESKRTQGSLKDNLSKILSEKEMELVTAAHDVVGTIAIVEIPDDLKKREKLIAETLLKINPQIKTVLKKADVHGGKYRTQKMKYLAGVNTKETLYKESNAQFKIDVEKVYFSIRLSNERKRVAQLVKDGEKILVMFSGAAPFPIVIARNSDPKQITGIEMNPDGHEYGLKNIALNKLKNVDLINADVHKAVTKMIKEGSKNGKSTRKYDRILMPAPHNADDFIDDALKLSKKGTVIHFYCFADINKFEDSVKTIEKAVKKHKMKCKILDIVKCGQHAPYVYRICIDFKIL